MPLAPPAPPGVAVGFDEPVPARFAPPSPANVFAIGVFERGSVGQVADPKSLKSTFGARQNNSLAIDALNTSLAEGAATHSVSRVTGSDAVAASITLGTSLKVSAASPGEYANGWSVEVVAVDSARRLVVRDANGAQLAVSPVGPANAALAAWGQDSPVVDVEQLSGTLPAVAAAAPMTGGSSDLSGVGVDEYTAALAGLDRRYGPGFLLAPGITEYDVHSKIVEHLAATNRVAHLDLALDISKADALEHRASLLADHPDDAWRVGLWGSWAYSQPIGGEPQRLVPYSAAQVGVASRVLTQQGIGPAPFGYRRGVPRTVVRLAREWATSHVPAGDVQELYAGHVNTAVDRGNLIAAPGYRTADTDELREDLHGATVRMSLAWRGEELAASHLGDPVVKATLASYHGELAALCDEYVIAGAVNADTDAGYRVEVDALNTPETMAARELHGALRYRPVGSTHWADLIVGAIRPTDLV